MQGRGIVITRRFCAVLLAIYAACVFIWDYTIAYQAALVITLAFTLLLYRGRILRFSPYEISSGLFLMYFAAHTFLGLSVKARLSTDYLVTLAINLVAVMCVTTVLDRREKIEIVMRAVILAAIAIWIYAIIVDRQHWFTGTLAAKLKKPVFGGRYSHNNLPMLAGYAVLFLSYFRMVNRPVRGTYALYGFFLACVILSGARKALLFTLFGMMIYPMMLSKKQERFSNRTVKLIALVAGVVVVFYLIMTNGTLYALIGNRFAGFLSGFLEGDFTESSARTRSVMLTTALNTVRKHFLLGIGLNTFRTLEGSYGTWSHNNYLEIMVSGGLLPLLIYYSFPVYALAKLRKIRRDPMAGMFLTFVIYLFIHDLLSVTYNARSIGLMLGMVAAFLMIRQREITGQQSWAYRPLRLPHGGETL